MLFSIETDSCKPTFWCPSFLKIKQHFCVFLTNIYKQSSDIIFFDKLRVYTLIKVTYEGQKTSRCSKTFELRFKKMQNAASAPMSMKTLYSGNCDRANWLH